MSVTTRYIGRFGNNLFQYSFARLFAEKYGLRLSTPWNHDELLQATPAKLGKENANFGCNIDDTIHGGSRGYSSEHSYHCEGFYQYAPWYYDNRQQVKGFFKLPEVEVEPDALAIHVRLKDYRHAYPGNRVIHPNWYHKIIDSEKWSRLDIYTDDPDDAYFKTFKRHDPKIHSDKDFMKDFHAMRQYRKFICSNSTFAWWAAFFGHAEKVYTFKPWVSDPKVLGLTNFPGSVELEGEYESV